MLDLTKLIGFEWNTGNLDKSYQKHHVTPKEAEELFLDENLLLEEDIKHSQQEARFIAIGQTVQIKLLFAVFTVRSKKIRIISVRAANKKERLMYEK